MAECFVPRPMLPRRPCEGATLIIGIVDEMDIFSGEQRIHGFTFRNYP
jgi:hypothetical protein